MYLIGKICNEDPGFDNSHGAELSVRIAMSDPAFGGKELRGQGSGGLLWLERFQNISYTQVRSRRDGKGIENDEACPSPKFPLPRTFRLQRVN